MGPSHRDDSNETDKSALDPGRKRLNNRVTPAAAKRAAGRENRW